MDEMAVRNACSRVEWRAGQDFECDEPPRARAEKAIVVGGRETGRMTPGETDRDVREQLAAGRDLYTLDAAALAALSPDLILTRTCAGYARCRPATSASVAVAQLASVEVPAARWRKGLGEPSADDTRLLAADFEADYFGAGSEQPRFAAVASLH